MRKIFNTNVDFFEFSFADTSLDIFPQSADEKVTYMEVDDFTQDTSTTGAVVFSGNDGVATGRINSDGDADWFAIDLTAGLTVELRLDLEFYSLTLYDDAGAFVPVNQSFDNIILADVAISGQYFVEVSDSFGEGVADYTLTATAFPNDISGTQATTQTIGVGDTYAGFFDYEGDRDWVALDLTAGQEVRIFTDLSDSNDTLALYDADGNFIEQAQTGLQQPYEIVFEATTTGRYYVELSTINFGNQSYSLSVENLDDDFAGDATTTGMLPVVGGARGELEARGDSDWFAINLDAGQDILVVLDSNFLGLQLFDADGNAAQVRDAGGNPNSNSGYSAFITDVTTSGTYYVAVSSDLNPREYTIGTSIADLDIAGDTTTTASFGNDGIFSGSIEMQGDSDWVAITLMAGTAVEFVMNSREYLMELYDANGTLVVGGQIEDFIANVDVSGQYYLSVLDFNGSNIGGAYVVTANELGDDFSADVNTTGVLEIGGSVQGVENYEGDDDWFAITLTQGQILNVTAVLENEFGSVGLKLYDAMGNLVVPENGFDTGSEMLDFVVEQSGVYYVSVSEAFANSGGVGAYTLQATAIDDDYTSDVNTTGIITADGTPVTAMIEYEGDDDWFAITIEAGQNISFSVTSDNLSFNRLRLLDASGENVLVSGNESMSFQATESGTYFVSALTLGFDTVGDLVLTAEQVDPDDFTADATTEGSISVNDEVLPLGVLEAGSDEDWFAVDFVAGQRLYVAAFGRDEITANVAQNLRVTLVDADGNFVTSGDIYGDLLSAVDYVSDTNQRLYAVVSSDGTENDSGYTLVARNFFIGTNEVDNITGTSGRDDVRGAASDDVLMGLDSDDGLYGEDGNDVLNGGAGFDFLNGGLGDDVLIGGSGDDILFGNTGVDTVILSQSSLADYNFVAVNGAETRIEALTGDEGNDRLFAVEFIQINGVNYTLQNAMGTFLTEMSDVFTADDENNYISSLGGNDTINGEGGDDLLQGGGGADTLNGGEGNDTALYATSTNRVIINMAAGTATSGHASGDTYDSIENITGSRFGDIITGDGGGNMLIGADGADILSGFTGDDVVMGGNGNDFMTGGAGADIIDGGAGNADVARYVGSNAGVTIDLGAGTASGGHADGDVITNVEFLFGSSFNDSLTGDANNNWLYGDGGDDILDGAGGIDKLFGGAGSDTFTFSAGDDFVYVTDFVNDVDQIDLSAYGFADLAEALSNFDQRGVHTRFFVDGDTMLILNTDLNDLMDDIVI